MNRSTFALFVALLIHIILLLLFLLLQSNIKDVKKQNHQEKRIKISLKELPVTKKDSGITKKKIKQTKIAPPMPKGNQLKKLIKLKPKNTPKIPKLNKPKNRPKQNIQVAQRTALLPSVNSYIPFVKTKDKNITKKAKVKNPMSWIYEDKSSEQESKEKKKVTSTAQAGGTTAQMKKLYGDKWGKLTAGQQKYMLDNQEIMRRITQQILTRVANVNLTNNININSSNVIEFYLHPNGDMSDFKFISKSGYYELDNTTKETIEYAYSQYPRPKEKILIRYNVYYHLASY